MRVLVACEFSGAVRDEFINFGHDAVSIDLSPTERPGPHYEHDVRPWLRRSWDLVIAFPPCTHLAVSGARWWKDKQREQVEATCFFMECINAIAPRVAVENPVGIMSTKYRKPDQIIQPWQHGHGETKATCLWLKGLPKLTPTNVVTGREDKIHKMPGGKNQGKNRSRTYTGIAYAMASQWGASLQPGIYQRKTRAQPGECFASIKDSK